MDKRRKYYFNENYFDTIDTEHKAYILGFIGADGNNNREGFRIELHNKDDDILIKIMEEIGECAHKCKGRKCGIYYYSAHMSKTLTMLGVPPAKTHVYDFYKECREDLIKHYIRGYFDGDGGISINYNYYARPNASFTGNELFILKAREILEPIIGSKGSVATRHKNTPNIITLNYCGTNVVHRLLEYLYEDSNIYLDRKYNKYLEVCENKKIKDDARLARESIKEEVNKKKRILAQQKKEVRDNLDRDIVEHINNGWSIRQVRLKFKRNSKYIRNVIDENNITYTGRRRMFAKDPNRKDRE